jgi:gamma-glutamyl hercynylcysteine S-oxide synthase
MLQTLQLMKGKGYRPEARVELPPGNPPDEEMIHIAGGPFVMGTDDRRAHITPTRISPGGV